MTIADFIEEVSGLRRSNLQRELVIYRSFDCMWE